MMRQQTERAFSEDYRVGSSNPPRKDDKVDEKSCSSTSSNSCRRRSGILVHTSIGIPFVSAPIHHTHSPRYCALHADQSSIFNTRASDRDEAHAINFVLLLHLLCGRDKIEIEKHKNNHRVCQSSPLDYMSLSK